MEKIMMVYSYMNTDEIEYGSDVKIFNSKEEAFKASEDLLKYDLKYCGRGGDEKGPENWEEFFCKETGFWEIEETSTPSKVEIYNIQL